MEAVVIIPARLESQRFPRKVLANATGQTLIQHVYESAARCSAQRVVVATDADEIIREVHRFGGEAVRTGAEHENGTSRLAEAVRVLGLSDDQVVVNVQGDEPEIEPEVIEAAVEALMQSVDASIGTVASPIDESEMWGSPNVVKVVTSHPTRDGIAQALYFSRASIPFDRDGGAVFERLMHIGIYAYRAGFLQRYAALPSTTLETVERLEQLRALEHGFRIGVAIRHVRSVGIDSPEDYQRFVNRWTQRGGESSVHS